MPIYKEDIVDIKLENGSIHRSFMNQTIGLGDNKGDRFGVRLFRNGVAENVGAATVTGLFMAPDGNNYIISGSGNYWVNENVAGVILPGACYAVEGQFCLAIKLSMSGVVTTMRIVDGVVSNTGASGAVVPSSSVPTSDQIIAAYNNAIAVVDSSVRFNTAQILTDAQKSTARENIDAASTSAIDDIESKTITEVKTTVTRDISNEVTYNAGYMSLDGIPTASNSYKYTSPIPVSEGDVLGHGSGLQDYRFVTAYKNGVAVPSSGASSVGGYTVPAEIDSVVISLYNDSVGQSNAINYRYAEISLHNLCGYSTPEMYGAVGDGATDDSEAIQTLFNENNFICFMSGKTYKVTSTINIDENQKIVLGNGATIQYWGNSVCFNLVTPETGIKKKNYFRSIIFEGVDRTRTNDAIAIKFNGNRVISTIEHCTFRYWGCGIEFSGSGAGVAAYGCFVTDCDFWHMNHYGIYSHHQSEQLQVNHCWFDTGIGDTNSCGIRIDNATSALINDCVIQRLNHGVELRGCRPASVTNCHFEVCNEYSIYLIPDQYQSEQVSIIGNYFSGGRTAIMMQNGAEGRKNYHTLILNNIFSNHTASAIDVANSISNISAIIVGCSFAVDNTSESNLIGPSVKALILENDENGNPVFKNSRNEVAKFIGDTLHLKKSPIIDM